MATASAKILIKFIVEFRAVVWRTFQPAQRFINLFNDLLPLTSILQLTRRFLTSANDRQIAPCLLSYETG